MVLHDDSQKHICGLVRRPMNSSTFEIRLGGFGNASGEKGHPTDEDEWHELNCTSDSTAIWSLCLPSDETRAFAWVRSSRSLAGRCMKLVDVTGMNDASKASLEDLSALADFEPKKGLTSFANIEVDRSRSPLAEEFLQMVFLTAMCLNDHLSKQGTNALGWGSRGFEDRR